MFGPCLLMLFGFFSGERSDCGSGLILGPDMSGGYGSGTLMWSFMPPRDVLQRFMEDHAVGQGSLKLGGALWRDLRAHDIKNAKLLHLLEMWQSGFVGEGGRL